MAKIVNVERRRELDERLLARVRYLDTDGKRGDVLAWSSVRVLLRSSGVRRRKSLRCWK